MKKNIERMMIFGRPGSGKSTFANWLSKTWDIPLYHLDKYFFIKNWIERDDEEFLKIQKEIVENEQWIIDGNSVRSLEMRWAKADLVLYFNFPKILCIVRIMKRFFKPNILLDDRAIGCKEKISWKLLQYMWSFEKRVDRTIHILKEKYPNVIFKEIKNDKDLSQLRLNEYIKD